VNPTHELVILSQVRPRATKLAVAGCAAHCYADYGEFRQSGLRPGAFIVKSEDPAYTAQMLRALRRDPDHATALAFVDGACEAADLPVSDGRLPGHSGALLERIEQALARAQAMRAKNDDRGAESLLLEYMWLRPNYVLEPLADWRNARRWRYPVLEALDRSDSDPDVWLQRLDKRGLLERVDLRDRQRECDHCGSAQLNFIDICPNCRSIEVDHHNALHCFTCGLVAPEERFVQGEVRQCPKCGNRLRHIGSDYDRPLETNVCSACEHVFVEGEVEARCMVCQHASPTTRLRLRKIYSWRLSGLGCLSAQGEGGGGGGAAGFEPRQFLPYPHFLGSLDWSLKLAAESAAFGFTLVGLHLENLEQLRKQLGESRCAELLEGCNERLRESLSDADLACHADQETLVLLLPHADRRRLSALRHSVRDLVQRAMQEDGAGPAWRMAEHDVDHRNARSEEARQLLQRLRDNLAGGDAQRRVA
jgi:GGDEF domain-containing protein